MKDKLFWLELDRELLTFLNKQSERKEPKEDETDTELFRRWGKILEREGKKLQNLADEVDKELDDGTDIEIDFDTVGIEDSRYVNFYGDLEVLQRFADAGLLDSAEDGE